MTEESSRNLSSAVMWQRRLSTELAQKPVPLGAGLLALTSQGTTATLRFLCVQDGTENWQLTFKTSECLAILRTNHHVLCIDATQLTIIDAHRGCVVTQSSAPKGRQFTGTALAKKGIAYVVSKHGEGSSVEAIDVRTGDTVWETRLPMEPVDSVTVNEAGNRLMTIIQRGDRIRLVAYDMESGQIVWQRDDIEGQSVTHWSAVNLFDLVVKEKGVWGIQPHNGSDRSLRFFGMEYIDAKIVGQSFLVVTESDDIRELLSFDTVTSELKGKVPTDISRILGAHPGEVLTEHPDGYPELFSLPRLDPIRLTNAKDIGQTQGVVWARDVAYLIANDGRTITALDLRLA